MTDIPIKENTSALNGGRLVNWQPGQSGNPKGKKKGTKNLTTILKEYVESKGTFVNKNGDTITATHGEYMIACLCDKATRGDLKAIETIMDRLEGKAIPSLERKATDNAPMLIIEDPHSIKDNTDNTKG